MFYMRTNYKNISLYPYLILLYILFYSLNTMSICHQVAALHRTENTANYSSKTHCSDIDTSVALMMVWNNTMHLVLTFLINSSYLNSIQTKCILINIIYLVYKPNMWLCLFFVCWSLTKKITAALFYFELILWFEF